MVLASEESARIFAQRYTGGEDVICLYDRGIMDIGVYLDSQEGFEKLLRENRLTSAEALQRYSGVVHLTSAALGAEEYYTQTNNSARRESITEARELDYKTLSAWVGHPKLHIIKNKGSFADKQHSALEAVLSIIGNKELERSYISKLPKETLPQRFSDLGIYTQTHKIVQTYTTDSKGQSVRLRSETTGNHTCYTKTYKRNTSGVGVEEVELAIPKSAYMHMSERETLGRIEKERYYFSLSGEYFSLDIYANGVGFSRLEIEFKSEQDFNEFVVPDGLLQLFPDLEEVTSKSEYSNFAIACK
jgi:CYTH domain-containing protein